MKNIRRDARAFFDSHARLLCLTGFLLVLAMFHYLFSPNIRMDSIIKLTFLGEEFNDLELGRFGIVYLNRLFDMQRFNPYVSAYATLLTVLLSGGLLSFMLWEASEGRCGRFICLLPLMVFLNPVWAEQLYFSYQSFLVALGFALMVVAVVMAEYGEGLRWRFAAALLAFTALSVYQSFAPLYLTLCVGLVLIRAAVAEDFDALGIWRSAGRHAMAFLLALAGYVVVNRLVQTDVEETAYLTSQVIWGTVPVPGVIASILKSMGSMVFGQGMLDTPVYSASLICCIAALLLRAIRVRDGVRNALLCLGWLALQFTGFAMMIVIGHRAVLRSELANTAISAINFLLALLIVRELSAGVSVRWLGRLLPVAVLAAAVVCSYSAAFTFLRLVYTDDARFARDEVLAERVLERLPKTSIDDSDKTVVFIGEPTIHLDAATIRGEVIGRSLFYFLNDIEGGNTIISHLMGIYGLRYRHFTQEDARTAEALAKDMPCFPEAGCMLETDALVVFKFSEDYYYESQVMEAGYIKVNETVQDGEDMQCLVDSINTDGVRLLFRGVCFRRGTDARNVTSALYLRNCATGALYRINTACEQRVLLTNENWRDGVNYDQGGFMALCPASLLTNNPDENFEALVRYTVNQQETGFVSTGVIINGKSIDRMRKVDLNEGFMREQFN